MFEARQEVSVPVKLVESNLLNFFRASHFNSSKSWWAFETCPDQTFGIRQNLPIRARQQKKSLRVEATEGDDEN